MEGEGEGWIIHNKFLAPYSAVSWMGHMHACPPSLHQVTLLSSSHILAPFSVSHVLVLLTSPSGRNSPAGLTSQWVKGWGSRRPWTAWGPPWVGYDKMGASSVGREGQEGVTIPGRNTEWGVR